MHDTCHLPIRLAYPEAAVIDPYVCHIDIQ